MEQKYNNGKKIEEITKALALLEENQEWVERYKNYISNALVKEKGKHPFNKPKGLSLYSSVSMYKGNTYDLRYDGQSVGKICWSKDSLILEPQTKANEKYFDLEGLPEAMPWLSPEAEKFRKFFKDKAAASSDIRLKSPEHRVENRLLKEFSINKGNEKSLCYIQPIKLNRYFFQFPTPLKASDHKKGLSYAKQYGGGIDIFARVITKNNKKRICVMEVKDQNIESESQSTTMEQALPYAVFVARLLRSESGQQWWDFFRNNNKDSKPIPPHLDIDVVTIMPQGNTEEFSDKFINVPELDTTLHCHSLYYNDEDFKNGKFTFSGTYPNQLKKYKRKA